MLSNIQTSIQINTLHECVSKIVHTENMIIKKWSIESISSPVLNFTTAGIFRIDGMAVNEQREIPWSLILKIIQSENNEKNNPQHHNYWKREALVNQSGILRDLPAAIYVPQCYQVEEKRDGTIWIWMEEMEEDNRQLWSEEEFAFAARQLGIFNGVYVTESDIPEEEWICRSWLRSWVDGCRKYAADPAVYYPTIQNPADLCSIYHDYLYLHNHLDKYFNAMGKLPRVLAHQDLSKQNMYVNLDPAADQPFTLIDWQFLSISGLGEDLGKLFGVALSQQDIPIEKVNRYKKILFASYIEGLKEAGWDEDITLPKYGFYASLAIRSAWEVPKLIKLMAKAEQQSEAEILEEIELLIHITSFQMELSREAENMLSVLKREKLI
ncbi:oxidoreductase family protein [Gracilibacillus alcaliphilus]|uniref:oxidoreductase family protein n=1 Tax=Gracilibacillus alcaliphilus TaxID=1401441 RepID=UPI001957DF09|nr:oxidoreductase family protein [Gracilibacillus alcaliphilus]MBM7675322.1 hypothetical protein [Gracilibacillus alcaliphilus]